MLSQEQRFRSARAYADSARYRPAGGEQSSLLVVNERDLALTGTTLGETLVEGDEADPVARHETS
jgi:hypothetical protein